MVWHCVSLFLAMSLLTVQSSSQGIEGPLNETDTFPFQAQLDNNYNVRWTFNSSHIMFDINVMATGWVGFGLSDHGDMYPGDMVIAWLSGDEVHFHDRHATGRVMPAVDTQQDWHLVRLEREDGGQNTSLTVVRTLNTCDQEHDLPILEGTTRVIYAYSDSVPPSDNAIPYHGSQNRGSKSVLLLDPPPIDDAIDNLPSDVITVDILNQNYTVPSKSTTYACSIVKFPRDLLEKHHMIRFEPVIQSGHEKLVHHILWYYCNKDNIPDDVLNKPYECYEDIPEGIGRDCDYTMAAWAIGGTAFNYPSHVGHSFGTADDPVYFRIETHYDNVDQRSDYVDSSGLRFYLTKQLRQHDAGMLELGILVSENHAIPPNMESFLSRGYCAQECFEEDLGDGSEIRVFADLLHSHLIGKRLATRHVRDGVELPPILKDDNYDFDYQETRALPEERVIKKGDMLITDCYYDSTQRDSVTYGGLGSREEMCLSFLLYYPRKQLNRCYTRLVYRKNGRDMYPQGLYQYLTQTDWSVKKNREEFAKNVLESDVAGSCIYRDESQTKGGRFPQPNDFKEYVPESACPESPDSGNGRPCAGSKNVFVYIACVFSFIISLFTAG